MKQDDPPSLPQHAELLAVLLATGLWSPASEAC